MLFTVTHGRISKSFYCMSYGFLQLQYALFYACVFNVWSTPKMRLKSSRIFVYEFFLFASLTLGFCHSLGMPVNSVKSLSCFTFPIAVKKHRGQCHLWKRVDLGLTVSEGKYMIIMVRSMRAGKQCFWSVAKMLHLNPQALAEKEC